MMKRVDCFLVLLLCPLFINTAKAVPIQRANSCVVMEVGQARAQGRRCDWEFELKLPGTYLFQLIASVDNAHGNPVVTVKVDGASFSDSLEKVTLIKDGIVWQGTQPVTLTEVGRHRIGVESELSPVMIRLVPQAYAKSRILISSSKYYGPWLKMHQSLPKQRTLARFKEARFGMFVHWGAYSVAAGSWKGTKIEDSPIRGPRVAEWLMYTFNIPREEYREFARQFNPDKSFAASIAGLAKETGMKYVVITSKHHDGFGLFDSACSDFDVTDACPYEGDLIKELYDACRAEGLDFGVYYSHGHDWTDGTDGNYAKVKPYNDTLGVPTRPNGKNLWDPSPNTFEDYLENKAYPQIAELIKLMPELRLIWFDGEGLITEAQAFCFYKMIYDLNPNIIVNRRIGYDFGDYIDAGDNKTPDADELAAKHFETCGTGNRSWGFKAHDRNWKSPNQLLRNLVDIVSKGGNYLLNVGPDGQGHIPEPCVKNFQEMGLWVRTNAEAVFGTTRWTTFCEGVTNVKSASSLPTEFWFSAREDKVYAMSLIPGMGYVRILSLNNSAGKVARVRLLGSGTNLRWTQDAEALEVDFHGLETGSNGYALEVTVRHGAVADEQTGLPYDGSWEALQKMPVPAWFEDGKIGIFIHWGPYSVIGYRKGGRGYAEHVPKMIYRDAKHYYPYVEERWGAHPPEFGYKDIIPEFKAENWDPDAWARLFADVGAKYVVLTAEHHDGWANWDSDLTPWNAVDKGPQRDLVGELGKAVRRRGLKYAPSYHRERHTGFFAKELYKVHSEPLADIAGEIRRVPEAALLYGPQFSYSEAFVNDYVARWKEIQRKYQPDMLWLDDFPIYTRDGNQVRDGKMKPEIQYFDDQLRAMITDFMIDGAARGADVYLNNKGGNRNRPAGVGCLEKDNLKLKVIGPKWESCTTFGTSYGYLEGDRYKNPEQVIHGMIETISRNGNFLINIGPRADGTIPEPQLERLQTMGRWLKINGDAIYGTRYWKQSDQKTENLHLVFTTKGKILYAIQLSKPTLPFTITGTAGWKADQIESVRLLGSEAKVIWTMTPQGVKITPPQALGDSFYAWSFEIVTDTEQHHPNVIVNDAEKILTGTKEVDLEGVSTD